MADEIIYDAVVGPWEATQAIRMVPTAPDLVLSGMAGFNQTQDDEVSWASISRRNQLAKFRAWDGRIPTARRHTADMKQVKLPPLSNSLNAGEYETRAKLFAQMQGGNVQYLVNAVYDDLGTLAASVHARVDKALAQVLDNDGVFAVDEHDIAFEADFGVPDGNKFTAATAWTSPTANAGDDLRAMLARYKTSAKTRPGRIITDGETLDSLLGNAQLVSETLGTQAGRTRMSLPDLRTWLADYGLPADIVEVETTYDNDETGQTERALRPGKFILAPVNVAGALQWTYGVSTTAMELINSQRTEMSWATAPGIVGVIVKGGPPFRQYTYVDAVGMPVLAAPEQFVFANTQGS